MKRNKIIGLMVMVLMVISGVAGGHVGGNQHSSLAPDASIVRYDNAKVIQPSDDPIFWYDWLGSSDRDGKMGALSEANPRHLILSPGYYSISGQWAIDTSYVYPIVLSGSKYDTVVHRTGMSSGDYTVKITPCYLQMSGFTISAGLDEQGGGVELEPGSYSNVCRVVNGTGLATIDKGVALLPTEYSFAARSDWTVFIHYQGHASGEITSIDNTFGDDSTSTEVFTEELTLGGAYEDVASFADGGGGTVLVTTAGAHGFADNWQTSIGGSVYYDGSYVVDYVNATSFKITHSWDGDGESTGDILSFDGEVGATPREVVANTDGAHGMLADGTEVIITDTIFAGTYEILEVTSTSFTFLAAGYIEDEDGVWTRKIGDVWENCVFGLVFNDFKFYDMHFFANGESGDGTSSFWGEYFVVGNFYNCDGDGGFATFGISTDRPGARTYCIDCRAMEFGSFGGDNQYQAVGARYTSGIDWSTYIRCDAGSGAYAGCGGWGSHFGGLIDSCTGGFGSVALLRTMFGTVVNSHFGDKSVAGVPGAAGNVLTSKVTGFVDNVTAGQDSFAMGNAEGTVSGVIINSKIYSSGGGAKTVGWEEVLVGVGLNEKNGDLDSGEIGTFSGSVSGNYPAAPSPAGTTDVITVRAFDSGVTYTNEGADGDDTHYDLPPAIVGLGPYTYVRVDFAAGEDPQIDPDGTEVIYKAKSSGRVVWDPGNLIDGAGETSAGITVTGAVLGDIVTVGPPYDMQDLIATGYVQAANTVEIRVQNASGGAIDLGSGSWEVVVNHKIPVSCGAGKYHGSDPDIDAYWKITLQCFKDGQWLIVNEIGIGESE